MPTTSTPADRSPLPPPRRIPGALREFLATEASGGLVLLAAAVVALAWANSPWKAGYHSLWETELSFRVGSASVTETLRHWVNEGLMTVFFFVIGLEIKRELAAGELRNWRTAAMPAVAALGGMVVPACLYTAFNLGQEGARGWGIPMATDIAFALGLLALLGSRLPASLRLFLLTLAIVDDVGAILVIAAFYSGGVRWLPLAGAAVILAAVAALSKARIYWLPAYGVLALGVWVLVWASGIHATIAGAALGLLAPARPPAPDQVVRRWVQDLGEEPSPPERSQMTTMASSATSVTERLEHALHPVTSFAIVPLFALANAGVALEPEALGAPGARAVAVGVVVGLVVGKTVGVMGAASLAARLGLATLPPGVGWSHVAGASVVAGIGFTVSLFVADLAFDGSELAAAKVGILMASVTASALGLAWLWAVTRRP